MRELERDPLPLSDATIAIVGRGRVGSSLARAAQRAGLAVELHAHDRIDAASRAEVALLCVPDGAIAATCERLGSEPPALVGHVSGASTLSALAAARDAGAATFSLHPLQTFPDAETDVTGIPCAVAGSSAAAGRFAEELASTLGMEPFEVPEESRAAYHAAASIASNLLIALEEAAAALMERAGVDSARERLAPLVLQSAANWSRYGAEALTGPIARGDETTVSQQREAIAELAPELLDAYDALTERARATAAASARVAA